MKKVLNKVFRFCIIFLHLKQTNHTYHNVIGTVKFAFLATLTLFALSYLKAAIPTNPVSFLGVDHLHGCIDVADNRACDSQNMIGDSLGSASKRQGSKRIISQAVSSAPMTSVFWAEIDKGTYTKSVLIATSGSRIYVSTSPEGDSPIWRVLRSTLVTPDQYFTFANANGIIVMAGDALSDPVFKYDIDRDTFSELFSLNDSTRVMNYRAKYVLAPDGYLVLANVMDVRDNLRGLTSLNNGTTNYPYRLVYSLFNNISSFTASRYLDIYYGGGQPITGVTERGGTTSNTMSVYTPDSAHAIIYSVLNLDSDGGDITVDNVATGFGCISPRALVNAGPYDIVPTREGLIFYDGGKKARLNLLEELRPFSTLIAPDYERIMTYGKNEFSSGVWYQKKNWYVFSFSEPFWKPEGRNNRVFIYDIKSEEWWPQKNWLASGFTIMRDRLVYGDSQDGYVVEADVKTEIDDPRKELVFDTLDKSTLWSQPEPSIDSGTVVEGTASLKLSTILNTSWISSMTRMTLFEFGEWPDGSEILRDRDMISFKAKISSLVVLKSLTVDLQYGPTQQAFSHIHSSVTYSSAALFSLGFTTDASNTTDWQELKVALSSFIFPSDWNDTSTQTAPFSRALTIYGIRFVAIGVDSTTINLDDLRIAQGEKNVNEAYYLSKQFSFNSVTQKDFKYIALQHGRDASSGFRIDVFLDYGVIANTIIINPEIPKEIFVCGYKGMNGFARLKSTDFSVIDSTSFPNANVIDYMNGLALRNRMLMFDKVANRMLLLDRSSYSAIISSFGSLGTGATNYDTANQFTKVGNAIFSTDALNHRIKKLLIQNDKLVWERDSGELGTGTTQYLVPTGITANAANAYVLDDGNFRIVKLSVSTLGYVSERKIDSNTIGEGVLVADADWLYIVYNRVSEKPYFQDVVLERRTLGDMTLVQRKILRPRNVIEASTYTVSGDFTMLGRYLFIGFTKDLSTTGTYYVQKLLKYGFDFIDEYQTSGTQFSIMGDAEPYQPTERIEKIPLGVSGSLATYIQLRYYDKQEENIFKLGSHSFVYDDQPY